MSASPRHLELLAPAKTADIGIAAINHGADAVYIGGPDFGARHNAGNDIADIERLTRHAHRYNARIFVTLNTILRDDELDTARDLAWQVYEAGADALIVQDMGLTMLDLPPIQLHASTQCDIRSPEKARFLQDVGFSQIVVARELTLDQIRAVAAGLDRAVLEFFVHGALCVAYSGQCYISHAHTGRSANRGDCSQACRLPYEVLDGQGRIVAHQKHVLSVKDNDQSANLRALVEAGVRSFKIEGRYKDMAYVKNITGHYRRLLDDLLAERTGLGRASSGTTRLLFTPEPERSFNRGGTDYFVNGRQDDIGAFDTPKPAGLPLGWVVKTAADHFELELDEGVANLNNGDTLTYFDLQKELRGFRVNIAEALGGPRWRAFPNEAMAELKDLRKGVALSRSRDMAWERLMDSDRTAERRIAVDLTLIETPDGLALQLGDEDGHAAYVELAHGHQTARDPARAETAMREALGKLGNSLFEARGISIQALERDRPGFWPASLLNALRRDGIAALERARAEAWTRLPRALPLEPPARYPGDSLSYLANVYNHAAQRFYLKHGVRVVEAAYESHEALGEVSLMITKHCVRYSLSLCPKQTKGVTGVQGTVKAEPLQLVNGKEKLTLQFDCKACEMHVVGKIKRAVLNEVEAQPLRFYRTRPGTVAGGVDGKAQ
ncbi:peptidase U32 family protein [Methylomagnum ishizawai]|uniref:peptidase U32 family protein n=1 Tax=Methylomagnum ishizawai TaxID=1760988 RepID=UPI001C31FD04|nr:U32 family peptidase [Methylomagnum ishizawai]BBL76427.1 putative protease YdcP [Methylomagnum ishizawai]